MDKVALQNADKAMDAVIIATPTYQDAYLYKARINNTLGNDEVMAKSYQQYLDVLNAKGADEVTKAKAKVTESYNNMASHFANTDKAKAKELLNKTLALDPANTYALESLKILKWGAEPTTPVTPTSTKPKVVKKPKKKNKYKNRLSN